MTRIYSETWLNKNKTNLKKSWISGIVFLVVFYSISIVLAFFLSDKTFKIFTFLMILSSSIGGVIFLLILFTKIIPISKRIKFYNSFKNEKLLEVGGEVVSIFKEVTIYPYVNVMEVKLNDKDQNNIVYFNVDEVSNISIGDTLSCFTFRYQVIEYEKK